MKKNAQDALHYLDLRSCTHLRCSCSPVPIPLPPSSCLKQHPRRVCLLVIPLVRSYRTRRSEEEHLNRNRKASVQRQNNNEQDLARLVLGGREYRVQVPQQERCRESQSEGDKRVVEDCHR